MSPKKQRQEKIWASGKSWNQDLRIRKHDPGDETFTVTHLHFSVHASFLLSLRFGSIYSLSTWTSHSPSVYLFSPNASRPHVQPLFLSRTSADTGLFITQDTACSPENMRDPSEFTEGSTGRTEGVTLHTARRLFKSLLCSRSFLAAADQGFFPSCTYPKHIIQFSLSVLLLTPRHSNQASLSLGPFVIRDINFLPAHTAECEFSAPPSPPWKSANKDSPDTRTHSLRRFISLQGTDPATCVSEPPFHVSVRENLMGVARVTCSHLWSNQR